MRITSKSGRASGALLLGVFTSWAAVPSPPPSPSPTPILTPSPEAAATDLDLLGPKGIGRFTSVNGPPSLPRMTMLLDTITGESWITCAVQGQVWWCKIYTSEGAASAPKA